MVHTYNSVDGITMEKTSIEDDDIIVLTVDLTKIDMDFLLKVREQISQIFPNNKVITLPEGVEMEVYKNLTIKKFLDTI